LEGRALKHPIASSNDVCCLADNINIFIACSGAQMTIASVGDESLNASVVSILGGQNKWKEENPALQLPIARRIALFGSVGQIARFLIYFSWKEEHGNTQYRHPMVVDVLLTLERRHFVWICWTNRSIDR